MENNNSQPETPKKANKKKYYIIGAAVLVAAIVLVFFLWKKDLSGKIVIPYIAHQQPDIDPHLPASNDLADKLDEALFDGLFNISANPSGVTYEDGLGELIDIDQNNIVTVKLNQDKKWHNSYQVSQDGDDVEISENAANYFSAEDLRFTLERIQRLGSLSPDYILVSQALERFDFEGPDQNNEIRFQFRSDRIWIESDIKEVLSFKILQNGSKPTANEFVTGSGPYLATNREENIIKFYRNPNANAVIPFLYLEPFIDNSTFNTELTNNNINLVLSTPFGSLSPILADPEDYFSKSNISTTFFTILFNTQRLSREQRMELRKLINNKVVQNRLYKTGSEQQRHIADYKGNRDNYNDYLNYSIFPTSTYYIEEQVVVPQKDTGETNLSVLPDTIRISACMNFGFREEYREIIEILNDPALFKNKFRVSAVQNEDIKNGNYDAVIVAFSGYKSNFLFDLYDIFLREPDLETYRINLRTSNDETGKRIVLPASFSEDKNFFRLDAQKNSAEKEDILKLLEYIYQFMSTREIGDKQAYSQFIDELEHQMALGIWLFSIPSTAYFTTQFDANTIDLYGVASQLSTIEKWQEKKEE